MLWLLFLNTPDRTKVSHSICFSLQLSSQLELWAEEFQHVELSTEVSKAEQYLQMHTDSINHMQNCVFECLQRGQDLCGVNNLNISILSGERG